METNLKKYNINIHYYNKIPSYYIIDLSNINNRNNEVLYIINYIFDNNLSNFIGSISYMKFDDRLRIEFYTDTIYNNTIDTSHFGNDYKYLELIFTINKQEYIDKLLTLKKHSNKMKFIWD
jgi:hypothetical protein